MSRLHYLRHPWTCHQGHSGEPSVTPVRIWKRLSSPQDPIQLKDCVELPHVRTVTLNAATLSTPDSLTLSLTSDSLLDTVLRSLVDARSSNSFIDSVFIQTQHLPAYGILPINL